MTAASRRLRNASDSDCSILVTPSAAPGHREILLIARGRIWAQIRCAETHVPAALAGRLAACWQRFLDVGLGEPDHDSIDDLHILQSWLSRHEGYPGHFAIAAGGEGPDWASIGARVLALRPDELDFDAWRDARDAEETDWVEPAGRDNLASEIHVSD